MDTTTNAIAKRIAEAREQMKEQSRKGNHWFPSMTAWKLADTLEAITRERDEARQDFELGSKQYSEMSKAFGALRVAVRNALGKGAGIASNPGWADEDVLNGLNEWANQSQESKAQLEAVTRERDMLAARDLGNVRDGVELLDLNSSLTADLKAVTKERDALLKQCICECGQTMSHICENDAHVSAALASRATPQEPKNGDK